MEYSGLYRQVVFVQRYISITEVAYGVAYSGLYSQVVFLQRYISITEVVHGAAYSGLYTQVVLKTGITVHGFWTDMP